ncbi:hypothetical protein BRADI_3g06745v3 [Brachypodium distachyon]|uniref:Uncharacterized protein n=1 Tax=Brachypodium distachyon TaxID=15368 RepID=A0A0Q3J6S6_BRADI|nr:hypothetical protein BRADI_3g06745v3 [Brachypodium distachyon]
MIVGWIGGVGGASGVVTSERESQPVSFPDPTRSTPSLSASPARGLPPHAAAASSRLPGVPPPPPCSPRAAAAYGSPRAASALAGASAWSPRAAIHTLRPRRRPRRCMPSPRPDLCHRLPPLARSGPPPTTPSEPRRASPRAALAAAGARALTRKENISSGTS